MNARLGLRHLYEDLTGCVAAGIVVVRRPSGDVVLQPEDIDAYLVGDPLPSVEAKRPTVDKLEAIGAKLGRFGGQVVAR